MSLLDASTTRSSSSALVGEALQNDERTDGCHCTLCYVYAFIQHLSTCSHSPPLQGGIGWLHDLWACKWCGWLVFASAMAPLLTTSKAMQSKLTSTGVVTVYLERPHRRARHAVRAGTLDR